MDLGICLIDKKQGKSHLVVQENGVYVVNKGDLMEIKGDIHQLEASILKKKKSITASTKHMKLKLKKDGGYLRTLMVIMISLVAIEINLWEVHVLK